MDNLGNQSDCNKVAPNPSDSIIVHNYTPMAVSEWNSGFLRLINNRLVSYRSKKKRCSNLTSHSLSEILGVFGATLTKPRSRLEIPLTFLAEQKMFIGWTSSRKPDWSAVSKCSCQFAPSDCPPTHHYWSYSVNTSDPSLSASRSRSTILMFSLGRPWLLNPFCLFLTYSIFPTTRARVLRHRKKRTRGRYSGTLLNIVILHHPSYFAALASLHWIWY